MKGPNSVGFHQGRGNPMECLSRVIRMLSGSIVSSLFSPHRHLFVSYSAVFIFFTMQHVVLSECEKERRERKFSSKRLSITVVSRC